MTLKVKTLFWFLRRQEAAMIAEALVAGTPPPLLCVDCKHLGPNTMCHRNKHKMLANRSPVTGTLRASNWDKPHCEVDREQKHNAACGPDGIFWVEETRQWKRVANRYPIVIVCMVIGTLSLGFVAGLITLFVWLSES